MDYYDGIAEGYAELHREEQLRKLHIIKENLTLNELLLNKNIKILDVGCGPCWSAGLFEQVVGVDPTFALLNPQLPVVQGTAERLPFRDRVFDIVLCVTAFHHFNALRAISEMKRVVQRDGIFAVTLLKKSSKSALFRRLLQEQFVVLNTIEEEHDFIYFLKNVGA